MKETNKVINIIGKGNVGSHLAKAFENTDLEANLIDSRILSGFNPRSRLSLITVSDKAIENVAKNIKTLFPSYEGIVAHTSGSTPMNIFSEYFDNYGVFYPLQTFNKEIELNSYREIPIFIEGSDADAETVIKETACQISDKIYLLNSEARKKLHLASVIASNFVNAMYNISEIILSDTEISFDVLKPLIMQTANKVMSNEPFKCQTGPAVRGDKQILKKHTDYLLKKDKDLAVIYQAVSDYIFRLHNEQH